MIKYEDGHPSALAIKKLQRLLEVDHETSELLEALQSLQLPGNSDFAVRKLLIDMSSVDILLNLFDLYTPVGDYCLCTLLLNVLSRIIKGRSESVGEKHIQKLINSLSKLINELEENPSTDSKFSLIAAIYSVLHLSCTKNERNRTFISQTQTVAQTINFFMRIAELFDDLPFNTFYTALKEGCGFLRSLTLDDDLDVEFGLGSENARTIAKSDLCLEVFVKLISKILNSSNVSGISDLFQTLSTIITREELCTRFASFNGIDILMQTIYSNINSTTLELHLSNPSTVRAACRAIRNCVSRSRELRSSFLTSDSGADTGLEKLLNSALKIPSCCDEAKAALRDLDCKVELQELWNGRSQSGLLNSS
uniref:Armadillo repeat-containing protein 6 n=1 Tax=Schistosoma haematobium TaxID=6185 RepID=A0A094ZZ19_SCHHA